MIIRPSKRGFASRTLSITVMTGVLSAAPVWAHDEHAIHADGLEGYANQTMEQDTATTGARSRGPIVNRESESEAMASHQHGSASPDACPQLTERAELKGLKECVTVLTHQISDLLKLIMNLSDALAESRNELLQRINENSQQSPTSAMANNS